MNVVNKYSASTLVNKTLTALFDEFCTKDVWLFNTGPMKLESCISRLIMSHSMFGGFSFLNDQQDFNYNVYYRFKVVSVN